MAHPGATVTRFGHVQGGAEAVLSALFEAVGPAGTMAMPGCLLGMPLSEGDVERGDTCKVRRLAFDDLQPRSGMGTIADTFRRPDVGRSRPGVKHLAGRPSPGAANSHPNASFGPG